MNTGTGSKLPFDQSAVIISPSQAARQSPLVLILDRSAKVAFLLTLLPLSASLLRCCAGIYIPVLLTDLPSSFSMLLNYVCASLLNLIGLPELSASPS